MNKLFVAALKEETPGLDYFHYIGVGKILLDQYQIIQKKEFFLETSQR